MERDEVEPVNAEYAVVETVEFGVMSPGDVLRLSVGEIVAAQSRTAGPKPRRGTIHAERMGPMNRFDERCATCDRTFFECPGHFGHVKLTKRVLNSIFVKRVCDYLNILCVHCSRLTINPDHRDNAKIVESIRGKPPTVALGVLLAESSRLKKRKGKSYCQHAGCGKTNQYKFKTGFSSSRGEFIKCDESLGHQWDKVDTTYILPDEYIYNVFSRLPLVDLELMGCRKVDDEFDFHPMYLIITHLPVLPYRARLNSEYGSTMPNEQTTLYQEIVSLNSEIANLELGREPQKRRRPTRNGNVIEPYFKMRTKIHALMDNSKSLEAPYDTKVPMGIKDLIKGKDGLIRKNLMGKRVNQAARTVIGPDIRLEIDEVSIPRVICEALLVTDYVTQYNKAHIQSLIDKGEAVMYERSPYRIKSKPKQRQHYIGQKGDTVISVVDGVATFVDVEGCILAPGTEYYRNEVLHYAEEQGGEEEVYEGGDMLEIGDSVRRHILEGDYVLFNRQPSLHKYSMTGMRVRKSENLTFGLNVAACKIFNADFDGDECTVHFPSTLPARAEIKALTTARTNLISAHNGKFLYPLVQDAMLGAYLMTGDETEIQDLDRILRKSKFTEEYIEQKKGLVSRPYTGKSLFSFCLPFNFWYRAEGGNFVIENGILVKGQYKSSLQDRMLRSIIFDHSPDEAITFTNNIQFIAYEWLNSNGFSIGIRDCLLSFDKIRNENAKQELNDLVDKAVEAAYEVCRWYLNNKAVQIIGEPDLKEVKEYQVLSILLDISNIVSVHVEKDLKASDNGFYTTVSAGSKGGLNNVVQIMGQIGQQSFDGDRITSELDNGGRPLVWYPKGVDKKYDDTYFEAHGMVRSSFAKGLTPRELVLAAMSCRPSAVEKTVNIWSTGYTQRRLVKLLEDVTVKCDETVRDGGGKIIQTYFGDTGLSLNVERMLDIDGLVESLNNA